MPNFQHKRGTRAALDALAAAGVLLPGQIYIITDEQRMAVAIDTSNYQAMMKEGEGGAGGSTYYRLHQGQRFYLEGDGRWISQADDNYGNSYVSQYDSAGTGADPLVYYNRIGFPLSAGEKIIALDVYGRTNSITDISDVEISLQFITPDFTAQTDESWDSNAEVTGHEIYRDFWKAPSGQTAIVNINDYHRRSLDMNYTCPQDGWFNMYVRPIRSGTSTTRRYFYCATSLRVQPA